MFFKFLLELLSPLALATWWIWTDTLCFF